jgi:uncharacterized protein (TIGR00106 family)
LGNRRHHKPGAAGRKIVAIVEVSVVPLGTEAVSLSSYVAGAVRILEKSGLSYELTAMGTIVHGELDEVLRVVRDMHESVFQNGAPRVLTQVKIDDRRDRPGVPEEKIRSVKEKL